MEGEKDEARDYVSGLDAKTTESPGYSPDQDKFTCYSKSVPKKAENTGVSITIKTRVFPDDYSGGKIDTKPLPHGPEYLMEATWEELVLTKRALRSKKNGDKFYVSIPLFSLDSPFTSNKLN